MGEIKLHKSGKSSDLTHVTLTGHPEDEYLGYVKRVHVSNSSPRGGAYRWEHQAKTARGRLLGQFTTRKEAVEQIVRTQAPNEN